MGTISRFGAGRADVSAGHSVGQEKGGKVVHTFVSARSALAACLRHSSCERAGEVKMYTNGVLEVANERNTEDAAGTEKEWERRKSQIGS